MVILYCSISFIFGSKCRSRELPFCIGSKNILGHRRIFDSPIHLSIGTDINWAFPNHDFRRNILLVFFREEDLRNESFHQILHCSSFDHIFEERIALCHTFWFMVLDFSNTVLDVSPQSYNIQKYSRNPCFIFEKSRYSLIFLSSVFIDEFCFF